jgi:adenosylhomocysteine nucleosidase
VSNASDILVVTGATFEADIAAGDGVITVCSGADPSRLRALLNDIDPQKIRAVISFGLAGGLDPALRPGDVLIADDIVAGTRTWKANPDLASALQAALNEKALRCRFTGADATVMTAHAKTALRVATNAAAVDMETHIAAEFAERAKLPWGALRAICDPASRALPPLATAGLKPGGGIDFAATLKSLAADPLQIPALIRTGIDTAIAVFALRRARGLLGSLGFGGLRFGSLGLGGADLR